MEEIDQCNSIFEQPWWLDAVAQGRWSEVLVRNEKAEVIARLPYVYKKGLFSNSICMPPNTQTLGPWISERAFKRGNSQFGEETKIVEELLNGLPSAKRINIRLDSTNKYVLPYYWKRFNISPTFSYRIEDLEELDVVYSRFSKSLQYNLRRSEKTCHISNEVDVNILYRMIETTFEHQHRKAPDSKEQISRIVDACEKRNRGRMFISRDEEMNVQVAAYMVFDKNRAYALLSGSDPRYRGSGAKSLVYWEQIKYAAKVSKAFDFEGSMIKGIESIIRQFGGHQVINYNVSKSNIIDESISILKPRIKRIIGYKM